jgi:hypothetical protein
MLLATGAMLGLLAACGDQMPETTRDSTRDTTMITTTIATTTSTTTTSTGTSAGTASSIGSSISAVSSSQQVGVGTATARTSVRSDGGTVIVHADAGGLVLDEVAPSDGWRISERSIGRTTIVVSFARDTTSTVEITVTLTDGRLSSVVNSRSASVSTAGG